MSITRGDMNDGGFESASQMLARRAGEDARAARRLAAAQADVRGDPADRLAERDLILLREMIAKHCALIEKDMRQFAARRLVALGLPEIALPLAEGAPTAFDAISASGCLADAAFLRAMLHRVGAETLAHALPAITDAADDQPSLLARLAGHQDGVVADAATALLAADARRRDARAGPAARNDLAAEDQHRLVWWVAAAIRRAFAPADPREGAAFDRALAEAADRALAAHDESERAEACAARLVHVLAPAPSERAGLMSDALADRRVTLFIALLADALRCDYGAAAALVLDHGAARLWLALRAAGLDRAAVARIGFALAEADRPGVVEELADQIDTVMSFSEEAARDAIHGALLPPDFGAAIRALDSGR
ncbi:MAG: DUF2336 domain-containing protein [Sphingomonas sp.]|uniref:DUF2336 domain-containing protein n=1 Tax=Sphingomonas sp. TaxID=28214 RepID=UPI00180EEA37|nr:hypothetical protein [Sphingobium sp.]MBA4773959.1 DUF2336 domain-containing protein [Sphingomonas sp.]